MVRRWPGEVKPRDALEVEKESVVTCRSCQRAANCGVSRRAITVQTGKRGKAPISILGRKGLALCNGEEANCPKAGPNLKPIDKENYQMNQLLEEALHEREVECGTVKIEMGCVLGSIRWCQRRTSYYIFSTQRWYMRMYEKI